MQKQFYFFSFLLVLIFSSLYFITDNKLITFNNYSLNFVIILLLLAFFIYAYLLKFINKIPLKIIILGAVIFCLIFSWQNSYLSGDIHYYILNSNILIDHQANPYLSTPSQFSNNPLCVENICDGAMKNTKYSYGPLWLIISTIPSYLAGQNLLLNIILLKLILIAFFVSSGFILYKIINITNPTQKKIYTYLFLWNPFLIIEIASSGHNDIIIIFLILLSFYLLLTKSKIISFIVLFLSLFIKYITLPLIILYFIYLLSTSKNKFKILLITASLSTVIGITLFYPF